MNKLNETYALETIKQQCHALTQKGCAVSYQVHEQPTLSTVSVTVFANQKMYHFSDPDLNVIISQICTLHAGLNKEESIFKKFINLMEAKHGKVQSR